MTEQENRMYAVSLMNRAGLHFDVRDIALVAKLIGTLEDDMAAWLDGQLLGSDPWEMKDRIVGEVSSGAWRPAQPQPITAVESNLR